MEFRCKDTGELLNPAQVRAARPRMFLPDDAKRWDDGTLRLARVERVESTAPPEYSPRVFRAVRDGVVQREGRWWQAWRLEPLYSSIEALRDGLVGLVRGIARERREAGIIVGGIPVRTDDGAVARLTGAKLGGQGVSFVAGDQVHELSAATVEELFLAVHDHIQACYRQEANLIRALHAAEDPGAVDLAEGWPQ